MTGFPRVPIEDLVIDGRAKHDGGGDASEVWCLNLDQIEPDSGRILNRVMVQRDDLGPSTYPFSAGTVLYSKLRPYLNKVVVPDADGFATTELVPLRCKQEKVLPAYLAHFLRSPEFVGFANTVVAGAKMPRMVMSEFWKYEAPLPPLPEQRRISAILDKADALRAKRRESLAQLDQLAQSIFVEMFGDPVTNPKMWPVVPFSNLCSRVTVGIVVQPASYYRETGVPALRSLNIKPGRIVLDDLVYFSEQDNNSRLKKTQLRAGDLVLVRSGQPGTTAVVPAELDGINAIDILIASPRPNEASPAYLCNFFNSSAGRALILSSQRGQVQKHLNVGSLNSAAIMLPPLSLQRQFEKRISEVKALSIQLTDGLVQLDSMFESLQFNAFRGLL